MPQQLPEARAGRRVGVRPALGRATRGGQTSGERIREDGHLLGRRDVVRDQLEARFGPLPPEVALKVAVLPHERLKEVSIAILTAQSLKELGLADE